MSDERLGYLMGSLPSEVAIQVLSFAPMGSFGRLALVCSAMERLVRERAPWYECVSTLEGPFEDACVSCERERACQAFALLAFAASPSRRAARLVTQPLPGSCGLGVAALAARPGRDGRDETTLLAIDGAGKAAIASWWSCDDRTPEDEVRFGGFEDGDGCDPAGEGDARPPPWAPNWWRLFDVKRQRRRARLRVSDVAWAEDQGYGATALTCGYDGKVRRHAISDGTFRVLGDPVFDFGEHAPCWTVAAAPGLPYLLAAIGAGTARLRDVRSGQHKGASTVTFSPRDLEERW